MALDSVLLLLLARKLLNAEELIATIECAIATSRRMAEEGEHLEISGPAAGLLSQIAISLAAHSPVINAPPNQR
ncbi:MAG: hypothetical protein ABIT36_10465 [Steroidobacteraceae bacterium]